MMTEDAAGKLPKALIEDKNEPNELGKKKHKVPPNYDTRRLRSIVHACQAMTIRLSAIESHPSLCSAKYCTSRLAASEV